MSVPFEFEIIVVDNASGDGLTNMIEAEFFGVKLIKAEQNRGYAAGNNLGLKAAQGKYALILNPDVTIEEKSIIALLDFMEQNPLCGIAGPKIFNPDGSLQYTCLRFPDWKLPFYRRTFLGKTKGGQKWNSNYLMADWGHDKNKKVDWLFGCVLMVRKEALAKAGLLDERYFLYMEDLDWCRRFWENNWQVWYVAVAAAIHFHQRLSAEASLFNVLFSKSARTHLSSWIEYYRKFSKRALPEVN